MIYGNDVENNPGFGFCILCVYVLTINIRINPQKQHKSSLLKCNANKPWVIQVGWKGYRDDYMFLPMTADRMATGINQYDWFIGVTL